LLQAIISLDSDRRSDNDHGRPRGMIVCSKTRSVWDCRSLPVLVTVLASIHLSVGSH